MHVLVAEPHHQGHRLNVASLMLEAVGRLPGVTATFATSKAAAGSPQFAEWVRPRLGKANVDTSLPDPAATITLGWYRTQFRAMNQTVRRLGAKHVLVPSGDGMTHAGVGQGLFRRRAGVEYEAMMLRGKVAYHPPSTLRRRLEQRAWLMGLALSPFDRIHHMDPLNYAAMVGAAPGLKRKLDAIPDPVDPIEPALDRYEARKRLGVPIDGRLMGCTGVMDSRKGVVLLIDAFAAASRDGRLRPDDRLYLVGQQDDHVRDALADRAGDLIADGRILLAKRFVSDTEMAASMSAMDLVVTPYPNHIGSASITIRAAAQRRPVLASTFGWLGVVVPRFGLGMVCDVNNPDAFANAIVRALDESASYVQGEAAKEFVRYCAVSNFQAHWVQRLSERMGLPPTPVIRWDDLARAT